MGRRVVRLEHTTGLPHAEDRSLTAYRSLASAMLLQAYHDAIHGDRRARHFLLGGSSLAFWCDLARVDVHAVIERVTCRLPDASPERVAA